MEKVQRSSRISVLRFFDCTKDYSERAIKNKETIKWQRMTQRIGRLLYMRLCGRQGAQEKNDHCIDAGQGRNKINSVAGLGNRSMTLISEGVQDLWLSRFFFVFFRCG